jgi:hypothetical protein
MLRASTRPMLYSVFRRAEATASERAFTVKVSIGFPIGCLLSMTLLPGCSGHDHGAEDEHGHEEM